MPPVEDLGNWVLVTGGVPCGSQQCVPTLFGGSADLFHGVVGVVCFLKFLVGARRPAQRGFDVIILIFYRAASCAFELPGMSTVPRRPSYADSSSVFVVELQRRVVHRAHDRACGGLVPLQLRDRHQRVHVHDEVLGFVF